MQTLKDAATLVTLILLALTVRIAPLEGARELGKVHAANLLPSLENADEPKPAADLAGGVSASATLSGLTRFSTELSAALSTEGQEEPCPLAGMPKRISVTLIDVASRLGDFEGVRRIVRSIADEQFLIIIDAETLPDVDPAPALSPEPAETCESLARRTC